MATTINGQKRNVYLKVSAEKLKLVNTVGQENFIVKKCHETKF